MFNKEQNKVKIRIDVYVSYEIKYTWISAFR